MLPPQQDKNRDGWEGLSKRYRLCTVPFWSPSPSNLHPRLQAACYIHFYTTSNPRGGIFDAQARGLIISISPPQPPPQPPPQRLIYAMRLAYNGAAFMGWQLQPHGPSLQGALEEALGLALHRPKHSVVRVYGSGRTDAGVHASNQVAHFCTDQPLQTQPLQQSLNGLCHPDIVVKQVLAAPAHFHARYSVVKKCYRYGVFNRRYPPSPFVHPRCWWIKRPLNLAAMQHAANLLLGEHDFSAFRARTCAAKSPVRRVQVLRLVPDPHEHGLLWFDIEGRGFLQHMIRIMMGSLVEVGQEKRSVDSIAQALALGQRSAAGVTAPSQGLHLERVLYDPTTFPTLQSLWLDAC